MKALPDEEGIETSRYLHWLVWMRVEALPDEEGVETLHELEPFHVYGYEGTPLSQRAGPSGPCSISPETVAANGHGHPLFRVSAADRSAFGDTGAALRMSRHSDVDTAIFGIGYRFPIVSGWIFRCPSD